MALPIRILCVDDHPLVLAGLASLLGAEDDMEYVGEATNGGDAIAAYRRHRPDVMLVDIRLPDIDGHTVIRTLVDEFPNARIIALSSHFGDAQIARAFAAGAKSYLMKHMLHGEVRGTIRRVHAGERVVLPEVERVLRSARHAVPLTGREQEVLELVARGNRNRVIASSLGVSPGTVKIHVERILMKLGAEDRTQAVSIAVGRGLLSLD